MMEIVENVYVVKPFTPNEPGCCVYMVDTKSDDGLVLIDAGLYIEPIKVIEKEKLLDNARTMGDYIVKRFQEMKDCHPLIGDVRGKGLFLGVDLVRDLRTREPAHKEVLKLCWRCWEKGLIITNLGTSVLRIAPPLNISTHEADQALDVIEEALIDVEKGKVPDSVLTNMIGW